MSIKINTKLSINSGTHLPVLMRLLSITDGPILEVGGGIYSTPFLHWACFSKKRELVTYDNSPKYFSIIKEYEADFHKTILVEDWDAMPVDRHWNIVFIDHAPAARRKIDIARFANCTDYIVVHDTEMKQSPYYRLREIYPLFKYHWKYKGVNPHTSILSNTINLEDFKI
ncbi:MAG: hypothetical protein AAB837_02885 [Patescibacteria group bacterium]